MTDDATSANKAWGTTGNTGLSALTNFIGTTDAVDFVTRTNNLERMRVTSTGNVGIGIVAPVERLDVAGNIRLVSGNPTDMIYSSNTSGLTFESQGNTYGTVRMTIQNINGSNGALFEQMSATNPQLVDFGFKTPTGGQRNLRFETRVASTFAA